MTTPDPSSPTGPAPGTTPPAPAGPTPFQAPQAGLVAGIILVLIGALFLVARVADLDWHHDSVLYTSTHDSDTLAGWWDHWGREHQPRLAAGATSREAEHRTLLQNVLALENELVVIPAQDILGLGSEAALRAVADALPDALFTTDLTGRVTYWNAVAERITGWTAAEAIGRDCSILAGDAVHGCSCGVGPVKCGLAEQGRSSKTCTLRAKDGQLLRIVKNAVLLYAPDGRVTGALETFTSVGEGAAAPRCEVVPAAAAPPGLAARLRPGLPDLGLGLLSGLLLFGATRAFLWLFCGGLTDALCAPMAELFGRFQPHGLGPALVLGLLVAPAEELFWRGVVQAWLAGRFGAERALALAVLAAAGVALASGEPLLALATLPTYAVWGALAAWRGSLVPALVSHATWTLLVAAFLAPR